MLYAYTVWLTPLWAAFPALSGFVLLILSGIKLFSSGTVTAFLYGTGVPTACATLAWRNAAKHSFLFYVAWPLMAYAVFASSVGFTLHLGYATYWLIVPALYLLLPSLKTNTIFRAVMTSMTAHTVGALLVLLFGSFSQWSSLIPVVPFERCVTTLGILCTVAGMYALRIVALKIMQQLRAE